MNIKFSVITILLIVLYIMPSAGQSFVKVKKDSYFIEEAGF
jgi:hypothetical protein